MYYACLRLLLEPISLLIWKVQAKQVFSPKCQKVLTENKVSPHMFLSFISVIWYVIKDFRGCCGGIHGNGSSCRITDIDIDFDEVSGGH